MSTLSVLIPARNEEWLARTVADVLAHSGEQTDIIVVLDGAWADPSLDEHPRVTVIYRPVSIGQRAATNLAARISTADYILKLDAHCAVAPGFDQALLEAARELGDDVTQIPAQKNLMVYDVVCASGCGWRQYQGVQPSECPTCKGAVTREVTWRPKRGSTTTSWVLNQELRFTYDRRGQRRQEGDICDVMTSLGACFFMSRARFFALGGLDESIGSWGGFGCEIALKSWLSGGRHVVNKRTWFAHFFRVGGIGFPYSISGSQQGRAHQLTRDLWLSNRWPQQTRPFSWLIQKFAPVDGWDAAAIAELPLDLPGPTPVARAPGELADGTHSLTIGPDDIAVVPPSAQLVARPEGVLDVGDNLKMRGIAARPCATEVVDLDRGVNHDRLDQPGVHQSVKPKTPVRQEDKAVAGMVQTAGPEPATRGGVNGHLPEDPCDLPRGDVIDRETLVSSHGSASADAGSGPAVRSQRASGPSILPTAGVIYYTDSRGDEVVLAAARRQLVHAAAGLPIVAVSLPRYPVDNVIGAQGLVRIEGGPADAFAGMRHVVLPLERGYLTMARQILTGLELLDTDLVFFCEHDCLYPDGYFDFRPQAADAYYYAGLTWKVDAASGRALTYEMQQLSGLCGGRRLLVDHFRRRVAHIEQHGFSRRMGFEPGKPVRHGGLDDVPRATWANPVPIVDIRHGHNLTPSRWSKEQFRNQKYTAGWLEGDAIPGWGRTAGRFDAWLAEVTTHGGD